MNERFDVTSDETFGQRPGPPPLRIHHFLAVTAGAAALLSVQALLRTSDAAPLAAYLGSGAGIVLTIATAISATLILYGFFWLAEGRTFLDQPGHWLLVILSLGLGTFLLAILTEAMHRFADQDLPALSGLRIVAVSLVSIGICLWLAVRVADTLAWRLLFVAHAFRSLNFLMFPILGYLRWMVPIMISCTAGVVVISLIAAVADLLQGRRRDWPHWVGVVLYAGVVTASLVQFAWQQAVAAGWIE